jgi:hypothetical protein
LLTRSTDRGNDNPIIRPNAARAAQEDERCRGERAPNGCAVDPAARMLFTLRAKSSRRQGRAGQARSFRPYDSCGLDSCGIVLEYVMSGVAIDS